MRGKSSKESEIEYQKELCLTILDFFFTLKNAYPEHLLSMMKADINRVYEAKHLTSLKMGAKELIKMARDLNEDQINELSVILNNKFGITIDSYDKAKIEKVIKNGTIKTPNEYRMLFDHFEQIYRIPGKEEYVKIISLLLKDYQMRTGKV